MGDLVVAIDGPAGSGKSTTAREVARRLGLAHLDSGALYRALTLAVLENGVDLDTEDQLLRLAAEAPVTLGLKEDRFFPQVGRADVSSEVRGEAVTTRVSELAAVPGVRDWATTLLRDAARRHPRGVVCDGRDIGSVVFPDARVKVFLTASVAERARRRALEQYGSDDPNRVSQLSRELLERDEADSSRVASPLLKPPDAVEVDTSRLTMDEQVQRIVDEARKAFS